MNVRRYLVVAVVVTGLVAMLSVALQAWRDLQQFQALPKTWDLNYQSQSIGSIKDKLGSPKDDASAKGFLNWVDQREKYDRILKLLCSSTCANEEVPSEVIYIVRDRENGKVKYLRTVFSVRSNDPALRRTGS